MAEIVLVTGAYGFIGRHVARAAAARGARVYGVGHGAWSRSEWESWGLSDWRVADITLSALSVYGSDADVVIHCAAGASVGFSIANPAEDFERTVSPTLAVLEFMRLFRPEARLVLPSSAGVYGAVTKLPIAVDSPTSPVSPYGLHKKMAEELCRSYATQYGLKVAIARLFSVYGPGLRKQLLWDACTKLSAGETGFAGTGRETRDWIHVEDASRLLIAAGDHAASKVPIVNGGSGEAVAVEDILGVLADALPGAPRAVFSGVQRPGDPLHFQADVAEALAWGWRPVHDWRSGVTEYARWYEAVTG